MKAPGAHLLPLSLSSRQAGIRCDQQGRCGLAGPVHWLSLLWLPVTPGGISHSRWGAQFCCVWERGERAGQAGSAVPPSPFLCSRPLTRMMWVLQCLSLGRGCPGRPGQGPSCRPFTSLTSRCHGQTSPAGVPLNCYACRTCVQTLLCFLSLSSWLQSTEHKDVRSYTMAQLAPSPPSLSFPSSSPPPPALLPHHRQSHHKQESSKLSSYRPHRSYRAWGPLPLKSAWGLRLASSTRRPHSPQGLYPHSSHLIPCSLASSPRSGCPISVLSGSSQVPPPPEVFLVSPVGCHLTVLRKHFVSPSPSTLVYGINYLGTP